jgi:hypothetical protein
MALALLLAFTFTACDEWLTYSEENPEPYVPPLPPISLQLRDGFVVIGSPQQFKIDNSENQPLIWYSSNPSVATVSDTGVVQGISEGKAVISVITSDGKSTDSCTVTVIDLSFCVIENESSWTDSECVDMKNFIKYILFEHEIGTECTGGKWTSNYIKTNNIKIILSDGDYGWAWIRPDWLDRIYLNARALRSWVEDYSKYVVLDGSYAIIPLDRDRQYYHQFITHETMHLDQYSKDFFRLTNGMRPDICAAAEMLTEFLAWFYTVFRWPEGNFPLNTYGSITSGLRPSSFVTADMPNAVELQSKYMMLSLLDDEDYKLEMLKDTSLPRGICMSSWWYMDYAWSSMQSYSVRQSAFTSPLRQASKEDILQVARLLLSCRDPKMAGVTDEALWFMFNEFINFFNWNSKFLHFDQLSNEGIEIWQNRINYFQELIARWDAEYAAQQ